MKRRDRTASLKHERQYYALGYEHIVGMDEAGRGPWAGPIAVGAVCLPVANPRLREVLRGVKDSKEMTSRQRVNLVDAIKEVAATWGIGSASAEEIDDLGINAATRLAMERALSMAMEKVTFTPDCLMLDSMLWPEKKHIAQVSIVDGDKRSLSIAAASVLAKTWRDAYMVEIDEEFPHYGFAVHKGYGTPQHQAALKLYGPSPIHRTYYEPIQKLNSDEE